jgi:hypothetical protein
MAANWGILQPVDTVGAVEKGWNDFQQKRTDNALAAYVQNPQDVASFNELAKRDPRLAYQVRNQQQEFDLKRSKYEQDANAARLEQAKAASKILSLIAPDGSNYTQILEAARSVGVDVGDAPDAYDANWVKRHSIINQAFAESSDGLTTDAKNFTLASGLRQGDPGFMEGFADFLSQKAAQPYTGSQGETRIYAPQLFPPRQSAPQPQPVDAQAAGPILGNAYRKKAITAEDAARVRQSLGPGGQAQFEQWKQKNGIRVIVRTGTAADGRRVVQFEDGSIDYGD